MKVVAIGLPPLEVEFGERLDRAIVIDACWHVPGGLRIVRGGVSVANRLHDRPDTVGLGANS